MTRINCIPVTELTDKHLVAEYRELPRVFTLAIKAWNRDFDFNDCPATYRLGQGHVLFFYPKLKYLMRRYEKLVLEMVLRGHNPSKKIYKKVMDQNLPQDLYNDWTPTEDAINLNRERIKERLNA